MKTNKKFMILTAFLVSILLSSCGKTNVRTFILNVSEETEADVSIGIPIPELTQEVIDNDLVVGYVKFFSDPNLYAIPRGTIPASGHPEAFSISASLRPGHYDLLFRDSNGNDFSIYSDQLELLKVVIIESADITTRTVTGNL